MKAKQKFSTLGLISLLLLVFLAAARTSLAATRLPESFSVTYSLHKGPLELAQMTRRLYKNDAGHYVYESYSEPVGYARWFTDVTLLEKTEWIYHQQQLRPVKYSYERRGKKKDRDVKLNFNWDKMRVTNNINNDPWSMKIVDGTLDKLLYHLAVMLDLGNGKKTLAYKVADGGVLKDFDFNNLGEETLRTKLGAFKTIKLLKPGKRDTVLWCAEELNYLPVKIIQEENGTTLTLTLESVTGLPAKQNPEAALAEQQQ